MFNLRGKVALVTGAAQGMGRSHVLALAKQGATVVITDVDLDRCRSVMEELAGVGESSCFRLDVSQKHEVDEVFDAVMAQHGRIDILVNNAGIYEPKPFLELSEEEWDRTLDINLKGQFLCAQRAAKEMRASGGGRIINISSIASGQVGVGIPGAAHYTASKGGVSALTETLALELAPFNILVNTIAPGAIATRMVGALNMDKDAREALLSRIPLRRMGTPEEVAALVVFLSSDEASYCTGATFTVDGGWLAA